MEQHMTVAVALLIQNGEGQPRERQREALLECQFGPSLI